MTRQTFFFDTDFVSLLDRAKCENRMSPLFDRFIRATPLENDIPVWMAEYAVRAVKAATAEYRESLDYLLQQTVDQDLKHGIALSEGEEDARQRALALLAREAA